MKVITPLVLQFCCSKLHEKLQGVKCLTIVKSHNILVTPSIARLQCNIKIVLVNIERKLQDKLHGVNSAYSDRESTWQEIFPIELPCTTYRKIRKSSFLRK